MRGGEGFHPVLHLAQIAIKRHQREADPTRHLRQPQRHGTGRRDHAHRPIALRPADQRAANQHDWQNTGQPHKPKAKHNRNPRMVKRGAAKTFHGR